MQGTPNEEERLLLKEFEAATSFYSWAVSEMSRQRGVMAQDAYRELLKTVRAARLNCDKLRSEIDRVRLKHGYPD
jgi:hypothetical protein